MIYESSSRNFAVDVLTYKGAVLVDFWAEWCGPCRAIAPILEEISEEYADKIKVVKVNSDDNSGLVAELHLKSIPTLILFVDGVEIKRVTGAKPKPALLAEFSDVLG
jgi:thioredoxin 1